MDPRDCQLNQIDFITLNSQSRFCIFDLGQISELNIILSATLLRAAHSPHCAGVLVRCNYSFLQVANMMRVACSTNRKCRPFIQAESNSIKKSTPKP
jgi:hypothetical protein